MNTRKNVLVTTSAALLLGLTWTGSTIAQEPTENLPGVDEEDVQRVGCQEVEWHRDMVGDYPWVSDACHDAIIIDGLTWARFEAEFQGMNDDGTITSQFRNDAGRSMGSVSLEPAPGQRVMIDGNPTPFSELQRGQVLNFYVPEGTYGFATEPGASDDQIVDVAPPDDEESTEMAQAEPETDRQEETLPATAGPLPIIALGGLLSLLGGATLTMRRRFKTPDA